MQKPRINIILMNQMSSMGLATIYKGKLISTVNLIPEIEKSNKSLSRVHSSIFIYCKLAV